MDFGAPALLVLVIVAALALATGVWTLRWRARQVERVLRDGGTALPPANRVRDRLLALTLISLALLLLAFAAARPQFGSRETEVRQSGIAVALVLDVSLSMGAQDVAPNRFVLAQQEIEGLLDRLQGNRVGLVLLGGDAFVRFPLTRDLDVARQIIAALEPGESFVGRGTNIAAAIEAGRELLLTSNAATRAIVVISDGESFDGEALIAAADASAEGIRVFSAGVGTADGGTILVPRRFGAPIQPVDAETGLPVISRADFSALIELAEAGRGRFVQVARPGDLGGLSVDFDALESSTFAVETDSVPTERYQIFAGIALLLVVAPLLRPLWRERRRDAKGVALASLVVAGGLLAAACASAAYSRNADGNAAYENGDFAAALSAYRAAQAEAPETDALHLNAGRALHALGEFARAEDETLRATESEDPLLVARAFFNVGNHRLNAGDLWGARNAYIEALLRDPRDIDAKFNLELVNGLLAAELQPPGSTESDSGPEGENNPEGEPTPSDSPSGAGDEGAPDQSGGAPGDGAESGDAGQAVPGGDDESAQAGPAQQVRDSIDVSERIQEALAGLDRENPTLEQALAILDVLRERVPRDPLSTGSEPPATIEADER